MKNTWKTNVKVIAGFVIAYAICAGIYNTFKYSYLITSIIPHVNMTWKECLQWTFDVFVFSIIVDMSKVLESLRKRVIG